MRIVTSRDNGNRLNIAVEDISFFASRLLKCKVVRRFNMKKVSKIFDTHEEIAEIYSYQGVKIGIEWDTWSGLSFIALEPAAENKLNDIEGYLKEKYA